METNAELLFEFITNMVVQGKSLKDVATAIRSDNILVSISNSYCVQCGSCCNKEDVDGVCKNKESRDDGLAYCLIHSDFKFYPDGKKIPDLEHAVAHRLDPKKWVKPLVCHNYGPYLAISSFLEAEKDNNVEFIECLTNPCDKQILADYIAWRESNR